MCRKIAVEALASVILAAMLVVPSHGASLDASDMAFAFGGKSGSSIKFTKSAKAGGSEVAKPLNVASYRTMTQTEMSDTKGAYLIPGAIVGGISGGLFYGASCIQTRTCTAAGFGFNAGGGAALGAIGGPLSIGRAYFYRNASIGLGIGAGQGSRRGWW